MRRFKVINEVRSTAKADLLVLDVGGRAYGRWLPKHVAYRLFYDVVEVPDEIEKEVLTFGNAASRLSPPAPEKHHVPKSR